jgi:hypothetical protein
MLIRAAGQSFRVDRVIPITGPRNFVQRAPAEASAAHRLRSRSGNLGVDLDKGLENPSRDQAKQDERAQAEQL